MRVCGLCEAEIRRHACCGLAAWTSRHCMTPRRDIGIRAGMRPCASRRPRRPHAYQAGRAPTSSTCSTPPHANSGAASTASTPWLVPQRFHAWRTSRPRLIACAGHPKLGPHSTTQASTCTLHQQPCPMVGPLHWYPPEQRKGDRLIANFARPCSPAGAAGPVGHLSARVRDGNSERRTVNLRRLKTLCWRLNSRRGGG